MAGNNFYMVPAFSAFAEVWTRLTVFAIAFVLPVSFTVCSGVFQNLVCRANIAVIVFVVNVLVFSEESIFCHWPLIWEYRVDPIIEKQFCNRRRFVTCIQDCRFQFRILNPVIYSFESPTVVLVTRIHCEPQNPAVFVTGCFN